jgi:DinB superfamily
MARTRSPRSLARWRQRFVERIGRSRAATLALVARMPQELATRPRSQGAWSVKDLLAHIAAWEEEGIQRLRLIARGHPERVVWYETMAEVDRYNARAVRAARTASLPRLLIQLARTRAGLVRALRRLPPPALADPTHALPVTVWLEEFAFTHERGHRKEVRAWRAGERRRRSPRG